MRGPAFVEEVRAADGAAAQELDDHVVDRRKETTLPEYLIAFNDEWVPEHTPEQLTAKSEAVWPVIEDMQAQGVLVYSHGGIDGSTALCSVEAAGGEPVFSDGPYAETKEHLGGFAVIDVADDEAARAWAGRLAVALEWPQELHRFPPRMPHDSTRVGSPGSKEV